MNDKANIPSAGDWLEQLIVDQPPIDWPKVRAGSDVAVFPLPAGDALATAIDTLVAGVHFTMETTPADIGYKALAVNLSDLAAVGATPWAALLSLSASGLDKHWLNEFAHGFKTLAGQFSIKLLGATLSDGPLAVTINAYGHLPAPLALCRDGARAGDLIFVTGTLGDAGLALALAGGKITAAPSLGDRRFLEARLNRPQPRVAVGLALRDLASSAIDVSDGLLADLTHVLRASHVGAMVDVTCLPLSTAMTTNVSLHEAQQLALSAGDDYELCFTVPPKHLARLESVQTDFDCPIQYIGNIEAGRALRCVDGGRSWPVTRLGYQHFR